MSVTTVSSSMITDATILNADIGAAAAIATTKLGAGATVQVVNVMDSAVGTGTGVYNLDDSVPANSEGDEAFTLAVTPTSASNKLKIEVVVNVASSIAARPFAGLFQDTTSAAIAAAIIWIPNANNLGLISFTHYMTAGTTSATTFKVRVGSNSSATTTFNGQSGSRIFGGVIPSSITITEIQV